VKTAGASGAMFSPFELRGMQLRNRVVMAPMSRYSCPDRMPNDELVAYYRRRAQAQVGLVVTGAAAIDRPAANNSPLLADFRPVCYPMWKRAVEAVHEAGGVIAIQLWHAGGLYEFDPEYRPAPRESPSGLEAPGQEVGEPMSEEAIADVITAYGRAATAAKTLGFDAVEIHAAHGFLLDQFFWSETNRRRDRWGGSLISERARFAAAVIHEVRASVGHGFPVLARISQWKEQDYGARLANDPEEMRAWLQPLVDAGVDCFHCSQRRWWEAQFDGSDLNLAGWVKKVTGKPTITVGSVGLDVDVMSFFNGVAATPTSLGAVEERLGRGEFDLIAVGRALLADPQWVLKVMDGRYQEMKPFDKSVTGIVW
jgi:2,4-dienoyl-CoA reductase-like NADH-dependent reductase (Old Yellow Enzyme family)